MYFDLFYDSEFVTSSDFRKKLGFDSNRPHMILVRISQVVRSRDMKTSGIILQ